MRKETFAFSAVLAALFLVPDTAEAHGRLPEVTRISFGPDRMVVARASFGLLVSRDGGSQWDLVCGKSVGFDLIEDPIYAAGADGTLYATTAKGLSISTDGACTWAPAGSSSPFVDVTPDGRTALSSRFVASDGADLRYETRLWRSGAPFGASADASLVPNSFVVSGSRIDVAAVRYGSGARSAVVVTSRDDGATWSESPVTLVSGEERIAAVAGDADRVYLRTMSKGASRLLVMEAGGMRTVREAPGGISAVAFSPDLADVWIAEGDAGIAHAATKDFAFEKVSSLAASCLSVDAQGVWACGVQWKSGFVIGLSKDGGRNFEPRLTLCGIRGDLECAQGCAGEWERERHELGCDAVVPQAIPVSESPAETVVPETVEASACSLGAVRARRVSFVAVFLLAALACVRRVQSRDGGKELRDDQAR